MPNNRSQALKRLNGLIRSLKRKPQMAKDYVEFMQKIIEKGHASPVPTKELTKSQSGKVWYLPHFGVYHPKKPTQEWCSTHQPNMVVYRSTESYYQDQTS